MRARIFMIADNIRSTKDAICIESISSRKALVLIMRPIDPVIDKLSLVLQYVLGAAFHVTDVIYE